MEPGRSVVPTASRCMCASCRQPNGHAAISCFTQPVIVLYPSPPRQLGWTDAIRLDSTTLKAGATKAVNVSLPTQSAPSSGVPQVLRVVPNWYASTSSLRIWASYRTREGGDDDMGTTLTGRVHIYTGSINGPDDWVITNWEASLARELEGWMGSHVAHGGWLEGGRQCYVPSNTALPPEQAVQEPSLRVCSSRRALSSLPLPPP